MMLRWGAACHYQRCVHAAGKTRAGAGAGGARGQRVWLDVSFAEAELE